MSPLIEMVGITRVYGADDARVRALANIDLTIRSGEFVAIMGPSGSGKSTLMNILGLLDRPTEGRYWFGGKEVLELNSDKLAEHRNRDVGFVFQGFNLLPRASAAENVALPLVYRGLRSDERHRKAVVALEMVGLRHRLDHKPRQLSGGEQQRVAIARAIVGDPPLLLADEPTGALDSKTGEEILAIFRSLHEGGRTIVLITHDPAVARHAQRIVLIGDGKIVGDDIVGEALHIARDSEGVPA
jgi:putative ABC transport system ATP-binding protein